MPYFSIYTPTHNAKYLLRAAASLEAQKFKDFEWIIMPNGKVELPDVSKLPNCRIIEPSDKNSKVIGLLKGECCDVAKGNVLVELDHDDELTPDCLEELHKAFSDISVDFCYSNCAELDSKLEPHSYSSAFGWKDRPFIYNGRIIKEQLSFHPTAASFSKIWVAPNHVRAWRRSFYDKIISELSCGLKTSLYPIVSNLFIVLLINSGFVNTFPSKNIFFGKTPPSLSIISLIITQSCPSVSILRVSRVLTSYLSTSFFQVIISEVVCFNKNSNFNLTLTGPKTKELLYM